MKDKKRLTQKSYYLDSELDIDIIEFLDNCKKNSYRNQSELIRSALMLQMRVDSGQIDIDNNSKQSNNVKKEPQTKKEEKSDTIVIEKPKENLEANNDDISSFLKSCNIKK